jgi:hypothetical protein
MTNLLLIIAGLTFLTSLYTIFKYHSAKISVMNLVEDRFRLSKYELSYKAKDGVDALIKEIVLEKEKQIIEDYSKKLNEIIVDSIQVQNSVDSAVEHLTYDLTQAASEEYVKQHLPAILANIDVKAVSNAVLLQMTGRILEENKSISGRGY